MRTILAIIVVILFFIFLELDDLNKKSEESVKEEMSKEVYQEDPNDVRNLTLTNYAEFHPSIDPSFEPDIFYTITNSAELMLFIKFALFLLPFVFIIKRALARF